MSTTTQKPAGKPGVFKVIEGGLSKPDAPAPTAKAGQLPGEVEAERLRRALLLLKVHSAGLTVEQVRDEICAVLETATVAANSRGSYLSDELEKIGIRFQMADPGLGLARDGFLVLVWPQRVLDAYPELAGMHPLAHQYLQFG